MYFCVIQVGKANGPFATEVAAREFARANGGEVLPMSRKGVMPLLEGDFELVQNGAWVQVGPFAVRLHLTQIRDLHVTVHGQEDVDGNEAEIAHLRVPVAAAAVR